MPKNIITLGVGGAGCRMAVAFFEELHANLLNGPDASQSAFFHTTTGGSVVPRAVFVDTDPYESEDFRGSVRPGQKPFSVHSDFIIEGKENAARSFGRAFYGQVDTKVPSVLDRVRRCVDQGAFDGFLIFHSLGGGTGSGLTAKLITQLKSHYRKKSIMTVSLLPDVDVGGSPQDPINAALALRWIKNDVDMCLLADNDELGQRAGGTSHWKLNRELARVVANWGLLIEEGTAGPAALQTQLVASPAIPYLMISRATNTSSKLAGLSDRVFGPKGAHASFTDASLSLPILSSVLVWRGGAPAKETNIYEHQLNDRLAAQVGGGIHGYRISRKQGAPARSLIAFTSHAGIADLLEARVLQPYENLLDQNVFIDGEKGSGVSTTKLNQAKARLAMSIGTYRDLTA